MRFVYLVMIIFFVSLNLRPSITSVGPLLDIIQTDLGMSGVTASLLTALPVFCMGLFSILAIKLNKRLGMEKSLLIAMSLIFVATFLRMFVHNSFLLFATALFSGIGIGIAGPLITGFIKKYFPNNHGLMGVYSVSMVIGAAVASSLSVPTYQRMNESWQHALGFWSILAVPAFLLLIPLLKKAEKSTDTLPISAFFVKNKRVTLFMLFFGCMAAIFYSLTAWLAPIVQSMGFSYSQSGLILTLFTVIQIPISFLLPILVSKTGNRKVWLLVCSFSEIVGILILLLNYSPWIATVFLGIGAGGLFPLALLLPIQEAKNSEETVSWSAMMQFGGYLLGALGPAFIGLTIDVFDNFVPALGGLLIILCVMLFTILKIGNTEQVEG
ncbi:MFS transporter [Sporosarcina sp. resist]|uniref:MFS transporter n=1 Tax=Sporosarcina sp. resist TaxID=2762563 RepID=UPI00164D48AC|nr:MFS transporter [Sporosarcina sp. resist]QNK86229.1 MFS transporter [Sporosarcina sp. resist]